MPRLTDFTTRGRVSANRDDRTIVFHPNGTNYALHLQPAEPYGGPIDEPIDACERRAIGLDPVLVVVPAVRGEDESHR